MITIGVIVLIVFLVLRNRRRCLNDRVGARQRPLFGAFGLLVLGALGLYWIASPRRVVHVSYTSPRAAEAVLDMREDEAIHRRTVIMPTQLAKDQVNAERDRVKQMIADIAADAREEVGDIKDKIVDALKGGEESVASAAETAESVKAEAEQTPAPATAEDPFGDVPADAKRIAPTAPIVTATAPAKVAPAKVAAAPRPKWVDEPAGLVSGVYYKNIVVGPYATRAGCDEALAEELNVAVNQYIETYLGPGASQTVSLQPSYIHSRIMKELYEETYDASFGPMKNLHVRLAFDSKVQHDLRGMFHHALSEERMKEVALGAGGVLLLLGTMFSYLKLDTITRGYYTGRLRVAVALVILGAGAAAFMLGSAPH